MDVRELLDQAKEKNGLNSDNKLAKLIGTSQPTIFRIRQGFGYPSEENMVKLGELAGISRAEALLLLNFWKSQGEAKTVYSDLLRRLAASALCFIMLMPVPAYSAPSAQDNVTSMQGYCILWIIKELNPKVACTYHDKFRN